jgi:hypothetical protein
MSSASGSIAPSTTTTNSSAGLQSPGRLRPTPSTAVAGATLTTYSPSDQAAGASGGTRR